MGDVGEDDAETENRRRSRRHSAEVVRAWQQALQSHRRLAEMARREGRLDAAAIEDGSVRHIEVQLQAEFERFPELQDPERVKELAPTKWERWRAWLMNH